MTTAETHRPKPPAFMWIAGKPCRLKISATCFGAAWGQEKATLPPVSPTPLWKKRLPSAWQTLQHTQWPCRQLWGQERIYFPPLQLPPA
jgi:phage DNA replication protein (predicted replicative helicase loader)